MRTEVNTEQRSDAGALVLILVTVAVTGASMIGPATIRTLIAQFSVYIWGVLLVATYFTFRKRPGSVSLLLLQVTTILVGVGLLLKDANDVPFGYFGGLIWFGVFIATFVFGLLYFAQFVLPLLGNEGWSEGLRLLARPHDLASAPSPAPSRQARPTLKASEVIARPNGQAELPTSFKLLRAGLLKSYEVLALATGIGFSRPAGPGLVMLYRGERIASQIDLRPHLRRQTVEANTRDGIPIQTEISVKFRVQQAPNGQRDAQLPHPYDKDAIFKVIYASSIDELDTLRPWTEQLCPRAAALLISEISRYTLNELYQSDESGFNVFETIKKEVKQELEGSAARDGIEVVDINFGQFELPASVTDQRIRTWQADWKRRIREQQASSNAQVLRRIEEARARSQVEIIENISQNIHAMRQSGGSDLTEIIMLRMIEALEKALSDETLQTLLPHQLMTQMMMDSSAKLQEWVDQPPPGGQT